MIALVTGGTGGIGEAICKSLASAGYNVVTTTQNQELGDIWVAKQKIDGYNFTAIECDVSDWNASVATVATIKKNTGSINVLINNAGITRDATLKKMTSEQWFDVINTNLTSVFNMSKQVIDDMVLSGFGRIINISSINGQKGQFGQSNYSAAKAGIHGFTMALAQEVAKKGVTVNTIAPGYIATQMVMSINEDIRNKIIEQIPVGRLGLPEEIAELVKYLVSASFITGSEIAINGGQHMM